MSVTCNRIFVSNINYHFLQQKPIRLATATKQKDNTPCKDLFDSVRTKQWSKAVAILQDKSNNHQVTYTNKHGFNALHQSCLRNNTPLHLIQSLLKASPQSALVKNKRGQTPLRVALECASDDAILAIVERCPEATLVKDENGKTPLYFSVQAEKSLEVTRAILRANPSAVTLDENMDDSPINLFFRRWNMGLREVIMSIKGLHSVTPQFVLDMDVPHHISPRKVQEIYKKGNLLIKAAVGYELPQVHSSILVRSCPWSFTQLLLKIHPAQSQQRDIYGRLPIDILKELKTSVSDGNLYRCSECRETFRNAWYQHKNHNYSRHPQFCSSCVTNAADNWDFEKDEYNLVPCVDKNTAVKESLEMEASSNRARTTSAHLALKKTEIKLVRVSRKDSAKDNSKEVEGNSKLFKSLSKNSSKRSMKMIRSSAAITA